MERLVEHRSTGLTAAGLRKWGILFLLSGIISRAILQNGLLGMAEATSDQLLALFESKPDMMGVAAGALVLEALETCAIPVFCFLLVEGFLAAVDVKAYLMKVLTVALVSEIPYNLAMGGKLLDLSGRNPAFGLVLGLVMMHFFRVYEEKGTKNILTKLMVVAAAFVWSLILKIQHGEAIVIMVGMLWLARNKPNMRTLYGCVGAGICCAFSVFYMVSPMGMMVLHFFNGEPGEEHELVRYWAYPVLLAACAAVSHFAL